MIIVCIAILVPNLAPFISLIGAVFFSILGLFCPAVIHLVTFWDHDNEDDDDSENFDAENDLDNDTNLDSGSQQDQRRICKSICRNKGLNRLTIVKDVTIIFIAFVALVSGTYVSMVDILSHYSIENVPNSTITKLFNLI